MSSTDDGRKVDEAPSGDTSKAASLPGAITATDVAKVRVVDIDDETSFVAPLRAIFSPEDLKSFQKSQTYKDIAGFVELLNLAARNTKITDDVLMSDTSTKLVAMIDKMIAWVDEVPPVKQPMRFGNKAFRTWHARVRENVRGLLEDILPSSLHSACVELEAYLLGSLGHAVRIDYGTGHETSFVLFLLCLYKLRVLRVEDLPAAVLRVFGQYLHLCRKLQTTYWLEPAGSKGVWSLDDYQMLVFLFGSSQLFDHKRLRPKCILDEDMLEYLGKDNLYMQAISFIKSVKHGGGFSNYAPMLYDISKLPKWSKVNAGMMKMYFGEVLDKLPVSQHTLFGTLLPYAWEPSREPVLPQTVPTEDGGHADSCCMAPWAAGGVSSRQVPPPTGRAPWAKPVGSLGHGVAATGPPMATGGASSAMPATGRAPWAAPLNSPAPPNVPAGAGGAASASMAPVPPSSPAAAGDASVAAADSRNSSSAADPWAAIEAAAKTK